MAAHSPGTIGCAFPGNPRFLPALQPLGRTVGSNATTESRSSVATWLLLAELAPVSSSSLAFCCRARSSTSRTWRRVPCSASAAHCCAAAAAPPPLPTPSMTVVGAPQGAATSCPTTYLGRSCAAHAL